jgi:hypothetical protein
MERAKIIQSIMEYSMNFLGSLAIVAIVLYSSYYLLDNWFGNWLKSYRQKNFSEAETQQDACSSVCLGNVDVGNFALSTATECSVNGETIERAANLLEGSEGVCEGLSVFAESIVVSI